MFKNIIAPVQAWLLSQGRCVGCGLSLKKAKRKKGKTKNEELFVCKCGRFFVYNPQTKKYRRALFSEIK